MPNKWRSQVSGFFALPPAPGLPAPTPPETLAAEAFRLFNTLTVLADDAEQHWRESRCMASLMAVARLEEIRERAGRRVHRRTVKALVSHG